MPIKDFSGIVAARIREATAAALAETGVVMVDGMHAQMESEKSGRVYGSHRASAPGESPANWHDVLINTLKSEPTEPEIVTVSGGGEDAPYLAEQLEFGSPGGRVAPRPMFAPAADAIQPVLVEAVTAAVVAASEL